MTKRMSAFILTIVLLVSISSTVFACDEKQTITYTTQILFGDSALSKVNDENVKMLMSALYLCSEQSDNQGQDKVDYLKTRKVSGIPELPDLNIKSNVLMQCSHNSWEYEFSSAKKNQANRKKTLRNTVNKVFDFGLVNHWVGSKSGKCNSFAALLYYSHILSDYLADDPSETTVSVNGKLVSAYAGKPSVVLNGNKPYFTSAEKQSTESFKHFSSLDGQGRAGVAFANIGKESLPPSGSRGQISNIRPSGWNQKKYKEIIGDDANPGYLFDRCHLIAHQLVGEDSAVNLITGTQYLNKIGMKPIEENVAGYIKNTGNHVLYRVTPVFKGDNNLASGVQIEAYSVEDQGRGICYNVYLYNVQPGIDINYANGDNEKADETVGVTGILPFALNNASDNNPDLIFEIDKHLAILFEDQKNTGEYTSMINKIKSIAIDARSVGSRGESKARCYIELKEYQYKYLEVLKTYVPKLLEKEEFFNSVFQ